MFPGQLVERTIHLWQGQWAKQFPNKALVETEAETQVHTKVRAKRGVCVHIATLDKFSKALADHKKVDEPPCAAFTCISLAMDQAVVQLLWICFVLCSCRCVHQRTQISMLQRGLATSTLPTRNGENDQHRGGQSRARQVCNIDAASPERRKLVASARLLIQSGGSWQHHRSPTPPNKPRTPR